MTEPKILAVDERGNRRLVELEAIHEIDYDGALSLLYTASMTESGVELRRISSAEPSTQFYLDFNVMNNLVAGWAKFNADLEAAEKAREEHRQALIKEAYELAGNHIEIETNSIESPTWWRVSCKASGWIAPHPDYDADSLLRSVKAADEHYQSKLAYIKHMQQRRATSTGGDAA